MSTSESKYPQIRSLRAVPDPREPSYSDEENFVNRQPLYVQNEDDIRDQIDRTCHRNCNSSTAPHQRSTRDSVCNKGDIFFNK